MLVTVLVITAVGLLFGAGALLLFRFQCQRRIDRQHELEKLYAVRSALNYVKTSTTISDAGQEFTYHTGSERNLGLIVKPVDPIFPDKNKNHFAMEDGHFQFPLPKQYGKVRDYEYGKFGEVKLESMSGTYTSANTSKAGLAFTDTSSTNGVWWVNVGMRDTGGWLQEDYGRRYRFRLERYIGKGSTDYKGDVTRLCLIRNVTNESNRVGCRHGWPLSKMGERALVFEIRPMAGKDDVCAVMTLSEYWHTGGTTNLTTLITQSGWPTDCVCGIQLAGKKVSIFYVSKEGGGDPRHLPYTFSEGDVELTQSTYDYFAKEVLIGGRSYGGIVTNLAGRVCAPEMRAVFEVEAASDMRPTAEKANNVDVLTEFGVTPAYQYDVFLEHPNSVVNRATVAQKIGKYNRRGTTHTVLTYDTHGTEHKGFRQDEREHARNGN